MTEEAKTNFSRATDFTTFNRTILASALTFLVLLLGYSGVDKLAHFNEFVEAMKTYVLVPAGAEVPLAMVVIALEIWAATALLMPSSRLFASLLSIGLLSTFTVALAVNQLFMPTSVCGCWFTLTLSRSTPMHIAQNILFILVGVVIYVETKKKR